MTALPANMVEIASYEFSVAVDGSAFDIFYQPTFYNPNAAYFGVQMCVVIDGNTSSIQQNIYITVPAGYDSRMLMTEVNPIGDGDHTVSIYAASYGTSEVINCVGCLIKGILRMN
jgi:hypothetical protein